MSKRAAARASPVADEEAPISIKPSKSVKRSMLGMKYLELDILDSDEPRPAAEKKWKALSREEQAAVVQDTVRYLFMAATSGQGSIVESKLKSAVLGSGHGVHGSLDLTGKHLVDLARNELYKTFGLILVQGRKTLSSSEGLGSKNILLVQLAVVLIVYPALTGDAVGSTYEISRKPEHFLRVANEKEEALSALAAASDECDPMSAKKRGLLAITLSLIMLAPEKRLTESRLFELLESTGLREQRKGVGGDDDDDEDSSITGWRKILQVEFTRNDYLERSAGKVGDEAALLAGGEGGAKGDSKLFWYTLGARARALIGAPHLLEWICTTTGRAVPAGDHRHGGGGPLMLALGPEGAGLSDLVKATHEELRAVLAKKAGAAQSPSPVAAARVGRR
jgi:hypothetical protein